MRLPRCRSPRRRRSLPALIARANRADTLVKLPLESGSHGTMEAPPLPGGVLTAQEVAALLDRNP